MFCKNCGNKIEDNSRFCDKCGQKVGESKNVHQNGKMIVRRSAAVGDMARAYKIILDEQEIGKIKMNEQKEFEVSAGKHTVMFKIDWCTSQRLEFVISDERRQVQIECYATGRGAIPVLSIGKAIVNKESYITAKII